MSLSQLLPCFVVLVVSFVTLQGVTGMTVIETFKSPANSEVIEVVKDSEVEVSLGIRNVSASDIDQYFLRLKYKQSTINPNVANNYNHLLSLDVDNCISADVDTRCKELEVKIKGHQEMDNQTISLVVYKRNPASFLPIPRLVKGLEPQQFIIRVVEPTTSPPTSSMSSSSPSLAPTSATCPPSIIGSDTQRNAFGIPRTDGNAVLGVLLGAVILVLLAGNLGFMIKWYRASSKVHQCKNCIQQTSQEVELTPAELITYD